MIGQMLSINAEQHPQKTAVVFGPNRCSYQSLNARACRLASALTAHDVCAGDRVGLLVNNCNHFIDLFFATAKIGAVLVPLNFRLAAPEIEFALRNTRPKFLFIGESKLSVLEALACTGALPESIKVVPDRIVSAPSVHDEYESWLAHHSASEPAVNVALTDPHLLMHSSGTTGFPKAAIWTHSTTLYSSLAKIVDFNITSDDNTVVFGPLFHVGPLMDLAIPMLLRGGKLVVGEAGAFDPQLLLQTAADERATIMTVYPTMWRRVVQEVDTSTMDLTSLRMLLTGGEPIQPTLLQEIYRRFPGVGFVNTYGSTEGGPITTFLAASESVRKIGSIGKPAFGVQVKLVTPANEPAARGDVGELLVRSPFVCAGYWNEPSETSSSLCDGWWRTGDLASMDDEGFLWIEGRKKDMIISGAENIYPIEIERTISSMPEVREVSVIGVPDDLWGESVAAFVVREPGSAIDAAAVIEHCKQHLASYKKPKHVRFVDALPRTTVNKVSKAALRLNFR